MNVNTYETVILPIGSYGCEILPLTLREEQRLRCPRTYRKVFGAKRDKIIGEWRMLHNAELYALHS